MNNQGLNARFFIDQLPPACRVFFSTAEGVPVFIKTEEITMYNTDSYKKTKRKDNKRTHKMKNTGAHK
jgi:hypothetical protein